ncbi:MAG: ZIP family metal transporter [Nanoarchaeota archaeon]|nr:ZIP family metal transporter [Nanoarchaeota archaeon]|tara:strand:+ start:122 stop:880 length:759 start_codon:yes stop_codon:yes gene_type:complete
MTVLYTLVSVLIVSLVSLLGVLYLAVSKKSLNNILLLLVSLSAGTLLGGAFLHLIPESVENGFTVTVSLLILSGVVIFFLLEKFIHMHRGATSHAGHHDSPLVHESHKHHIGVLNLAGDGLHNFLDGLIIAGSYLVSVPAGIATTIAVVLHEVPQEIADFGVLLYAGFSKKKALLFNFLSATVAFVGAGVGLLLGAQTESFVTFILPFAAGGFIYIAGSNLIPELHKETDFSESLGHIIALLAGIGIMIMLL